MKSTGVAQGGSDDDGGGGEGEGGSGLGGGGGDEGEDGQGPRVEPSSWHIFKASHSLA